MSATLEDILRSHRTGQAVVMGILNVTPDSFSDGGKFFDPAAAVEHARRLSADGADIIDIGAESTRPGSLRVPAAQQIDRLRQVLPAVTASGAIVSIDTTLADVAAFALDHGAAVINDISAGMDDPAMLPLVAKRRCPIVLMHMLGQPGTMQRDPRYIDVLAEVRQFLSGRIEAAIAAGVDRGRVIIDPGIGFGKTLDHNLALLAGTATLAELGCPVLIGPSRKRFLADLIRTTGVSPVWGANPPADRRDACPTNDDRLPGTIAACLETYRRGATIFRVHDVAPVRAALAVAATIKAAAGN
jgi:dihydropteroate synthase